MRSPEALLSVAAVSTDRLVLRRPVPEDLPDVIFIHGDPRTNLFNPAGPTPPGECEKFFVGWLRHWEDFGFGYWSVALRSAPEAVVGFGGLMRKELNAEVALNLYFRFTPSAWGQGFAQELGRAALLIGLGELSYDRVVGIVRVSNAPSRKVLERLGLKESGVEAGFERSEPRVIYEARSTPLAAT